MSNIQKLFDSSDRGDNYLAFKLTLKEHPELMAKVNKTSDGFEYISVLDIEKITKYRVNAKGGRIGFILNIN